MISLKIAKDILGRVVALFLVSSLGIITGSSVINAINPEQSMPLWYAAALAGFTAVADVISKLARASLDGSITKEDVDLAFGVKAETREAVNTVKAELELPSEESAL
jgi:Na+/H+-dicarboxylate symporter